MIERVYYNMDEVRRFNKVLYPGVTIKDYVRKYDQSFPFVYYNRGGEGLIIDKTNLVLVPKKSFLPKFVFFTGHDSQNIEVFFQK